MLPIELKNSRTGEVAPRRTLFSYQVGADAFTFYFTCEQSKCISAGTKFNDPLYEGDAAEVFLAVDGETDFYYETEVAPNGTGFFAKILWQDGSFTTCPQVIDMPTRAERTADGWRAEITLPFAAIGYKPGMELKINAYRIETDGGERDKHLIALSPTLCDTFHRPSAFVDLP